MCGLSLAAAFGGSSSLQHMGFLLRWHLLLPCTGPRHPGFSSCCLAALQHVESSQSRARTWVPCLGRWILNRWTTRGVPAWQFLRVNHTLTVWPRDPILGIYPREMKMYGHKKRTWMFIVHSNTIHNCPKLKITQLPSAGKGKQTIYIHTGILLSSGREQSPGPWTSWVSLRCLRLSKRSQTQTSPYCVTPSRWLSEKDKTIGQGTEQGLPGARGWGEGRSQGTFSGGQSCSMPLF